MYIWIYVCVYIHTCMLLHIQKPTHIFLEWKYLQINVPLVFADRYIISLQNYICGSGTALEVTLKTETWGLSSAVYFVTNCLLFLHQLMV